MHVSASSLLAIAGIIAYTAAPVTAQYLDSDEYILGIREAFPEFDVDFDDLLSLYARGGAHPSHSSSSSSPERDTKELTKVMVTGLSNVNTRKPLVNLVAGIAGKGLEHYAGTPQPNPNMIDGKLVPPDVQVQRMYRAMASSKPSMGNPPPARVPPRHFGKRTVDDLLEEDAIWWM